MKTNIMGTAVATVQQMQSYIQKVNPAVPKSVIDMVEYYISEGKTEGVRGDIAFAQSCLETGNFTFNGSAVTLDQNNFAGIGVTKNGMKGNSFSHPWIGIRAQIQHLKAYASNEKLYGVCVDPRFCYVKRGIAPYVEWLGIQENPQGGGWAAGKNYGSKILEILAKIIAMPEANKEDVTMKSMVMALPPFPSGLGYRKFSQVVHLLPEDHPPLGQALLHVNQPLVPATPEVELVRLLFFQKGAVHQHVGLGQQGGPVGVAALPQLLEPIAGIGPDVQPSLMGRLSQLGAGRGLGEGLSPGQGQALNERVLPQLRRQLLQGDLPPAGGVVSVGVVAAGAVVGTALGKHRKPQAVAVYDGVVDCVGDPHGQGPPLSFKIAYVSYHIFVTGTMGRGKFRVPYGTLAFPGCTQQGLPKAFPWGRGGGPAKDRIG